MIVLNSIHIKPNKLKWLMNAVSSLILLSMILISAAPAIHASNQPVWDLGGEEEQFESLLKEAKIKFDALEEEAALEIYMDILKQDPEHFEALWNASFLKSRIGWRQPEKSDQMPYFESSLELAEQVLELYPDKAESNYVKALATGRISHVSGTRAQARNSEVIKKYAEKAVEIDPDFAKAYHLLGVWHASVSNVSGTERLIARVFLGANLGKASVEQAETYLKKSIELEPTSIIFKLDLARLYDRADRPEEALTVINEILNMDVITEDNPEHKKEARERKERIKREIS